VKTGIWNGRETWIPAFAGMTQAEPGPLRRGREWKYDASVGRWVECKRENKRIEEFEI